MAKRGAAAAGAGGVATVIVAGVAAFFSGRDPGDNTPDNTAENAPVAAPENQPRDNGHMPPDNTPPVQLPLTSVDDLLDLLDDLVTADGAPSMADLQRVFDASPDRLAALDQHALERYRSQLAACKQEMIDAGAPLDTPGTYSTFNGPVTIVRAADSGLQMHLD